MTELTQPMPEIELTDADRQKIQETAEKIDLTDFALSLTYGTAGQKKLAEVSDKLLKMTRSDDSAAVSERISDLVKELRACSDAKVQSGFFGWLFRRRERKNLRKRYESAAESTDAIAAELESHRNRLLRDFVMLDKLYDSVLEQYRELTVLTEAGQRKLEEDTSTEKELRERFEKRLHDLKLSRMVCMQTLTQIRILQGCNTALSEKIQSLLTNTLALWKNQTALALAMKNTGQTMKDLRKANGDMIGVLNDVCTAEDHALGEADILKEMIESENKELYHA
ncbi:MAG: toxic anion resistance protein [Clostridia bacterium]|nr:toxic anion resistance protein [Clostridia bacterium]